MQRKFLTAKWQNLIMANYIVDPELLLPHLPAKTEIDLYNGNTYVSLVGFRFADTRIMGVKIPFHINFEEVNLRFYVRYNDKGKWKRGVVFIKEIVPKHAITFIANTFYKEKYHTMPTRHVYNESDYEIALAYHWRYRNKWNKLAAVVEKTPVPMQPGSEEEFIAEHYWGYSKYDSRTTFEYSVEHGPWKIFPLKKYTIDCNFAGLYGEAFSILDNKEPNSVFVAQGSPIAVLTKNVCT